ncbi:MAG: hypothetical protein M3O06_07280 [Pseudomonadota bacterium]|nr:hypothetical protein [Pseudomonadota bacterium]
MMWIKDTVFYTGCLFTWFVLVPLLVISGAIALIAYALFTEAGEALTGRGRRSLDLMAAREIAHRICVSS